MFLCVDVCVCFDIVLKNYLIDYEMKLCVCFTVYVNNVSVSSYNHHLWLDLQVKLIWLLIWN